jgi:hypothetical protein
VEYRNPVLVGPDKSRYRTSDVLGLHFSDYGVYQELRYIIRVVLRTKTSRLVLAVIIPAILLCGCGRSDSKFNSKEWKGASSSRGAMVQDLMEHKLLRDKSPSEVRELLGKPDDCTTGLEPARTECDDAKVDWYGYRVVTISRCYFWKCEMNVIFGADSHRVEHVTVSD